MKLTNEIQKLMEEDGQGYTRFMPTDHAKIVLAIRKKLNFMVSKIDFTHNLTFPSSRGPDSHYDLYSSQTQQPKGTLILRPDVKEYEWATYGPASVEKLVIKILKGWTNAKGE